MQMRPCIWDRLWLKFQDAFRQVPPLNLDLRGSPWGSSVGTKWVITWSPWKIWRRRLEHFDRSNGPVKKALTPGLRETPGGFKIWQLRGFITCPRGGFWAQGQDGAILSPVRPLAYQTWLLRSPGLGAATIFLGYIFPSTTPLNYYRISVGFRFSSKTAVGKTAAEPPSINQSISDATKIFGVLSDSQNEVRMLLK